MMHHTARLCAGAALAGLLAGCGGGNGSSLLTPQPPSHITGQQAPSGITARIVGVGDSLTAGVQSNGLLGATISPNPLGAGSPFPFIPNTQGNGYYALLWSQANGGANPLNPAISPLPLIAPPGLGQILVPSSSGGLTSILPSACSGPNVAAQSLSTALSVRINPSAVPLDVAIPGQTMHEALAQIGPTGPCNASTLPAPFNALASLLASENTDFYPILGNFGPGTQVDAAVKLRPTLAVVWLGSNDLLKYAFSNGALAATAPASLEADLERIVRRLQGAGARVAVANLVDVTNAAVFTHVTALPQALVANGVPAALAPTIAAGIQAFLQSQFGLGPQALLTLTGAQKVLGAVKVSLTRGVPLAAALAGAGLSPSGDFVTDAVATQTASLNAAYNVQIAAAVGRTGAALADVHALFAQIEANGGYYPLPSNPKCCSLAYGGGFFSLDGLHPSDTGYAVLANVFIAAIDRSFGASIPPLSAAQIATINAHDPYSP
ncbi:MAG: hypothetical protein GIX03_09720 [Candidatus Eremiobacteraeota bacterium]|nr:hypothetical protein [Candidatus Eremiobacteraeota bacterium]MBC5803248.1 hypothetical protein [Candidatus Eremiobacteraeota bacterium]MBC5822269.1 hypothetical protein [Candidatus Eremiobacteraeota bacterium]